MICNRCNNAIPDGSAFCPVCGAAFQGQKCRNCGIMMNNGTRFCPRCGCDQAVQTSFCSYCNSPIQPGAAVCYTCGRPAGSSNQQSNPIESSYAAKTLTFGILGLAFAATFFLSFLGIIFSAIARSNLSNYLGCTGGVYKDGRAKAGNGLSRAGLIVGIISTSLLVFSILVSM